MTEEQKEIIADLKLVFTNKRFLLGFIPFTILWILFVYYIYSL